jgi:phage N-6-adenine-methyltransferase
VSGGPLRLPVPPPGPVGTITREQYRRHRDRGRHLCAWLAVWLSHGAQSVKDKASLPAYHHPGGQSSNDEWATPRHVFERYDRLYRFTLDVAATPGNALALRYFSKEQDGLAQTWAPERCWMNPPYSNCGEWMRKAWQESQDGALVVCLVPSRTGTAWFHDYAVKGRLEFLRGRLKFGGSDLNAPFESLIVTFLPGDDQLGLFAWESVA